MPDIMITRQPIFDRNEDAAGYEVRFRPPMDDADPLVQSLMSGSLDVIAGGMPVWVTLTEAQVVQRILESPGHAAIVAMVPALMQLTPDVLAGLAAMEEAGVVLAIDEFQVPAGPSDEMHHLLERARYARLDSRDMTAEAFDAAARAAKGAGLLVVADHVYDKASYQACQRAGADFFGGTHFARPEPLPSASLPTSTVAALRVLALARDESVNERELERAISADPSVTFQLLRIVNSASIGGRGIASVGHALRLAGRNVLIRWLALAAFASRADQSGVDNELTAQAVQRGYIAEGVARHATGRDPQTAFLVGLFSLLDAVFRIPMAEVVERINLAAEVREALLDRMGPYAEILQFIESYELGLWESAAASAEALGVPASAVGELYVHAVSESAKLMTVAV